MTSTALVLAEPLSFWGGFDPVSGRIIDVRHPDHGAQIAGRVLVLERTIGSSGAPAVIAEAIRQGTGPAAIVLGEPSLAVAIETLTPEVLYGVTSPFAVVDKGTLSAIETGDVVSVSRDGQLVRVG